MRRAGWCKIVRLDLGAACLSWPAKKKPFYCPGLRSVLRRALTHPIVYSVYSFSWTSTKAPDDEKEQSGPRHTIWLIWRFSLIPGSCYTENLSAANPVAKSPAP